MELLVVGATGRMGRRIVAHAAAAGHRVRALGRRAEDQDWPEGVIPMATDILAPGAVDAAVDGVDAIATALSISRTSRSPFARILGPDDLHSRSTRALLAAMAAHGVRRILKVSAQGVGDSAEQAGWGYRALVAASNLAPAFQDHAIADDHLRGTDVDWTVVRPPILSEARGEVHAVESGQTYSWTRVSLDGVAAWIVGALTKPSTVGRTLTMLPL